jgi:hypothetical protein
LQDAGKKFSKPFTVLKISWTHYVTEILKQLLTGKDNKTYDIGRVTWLIGLVAVIALAFYEVLYSNVSIRELAESLGIVSAAGGASVAMKSKTEPEN